MKFRSFEKDVSHVSTLPDIPTLENGYTSTSLKETFDRAGEEIKEYINESLLPELEDMSAAEKIGCVPPETVEGANVQAVLENISRQVQDISNGSIPDGTITPDKFVASVANFITEGSPRAKLFSTNGTYSFVPTRTGNYKITVQGAGGGGDVLGIWGNSKGGYSGACTIGYTRLIAEQEYTVEVGKGGKGLIIDDTDKLVSKAEGGTGSGFYDNGEEIFFAEGGSAGNNTAFATSRGGIICRRGSGPIVSSTDSNDELNFAIGAESFFGQGAMSMDIPAQTGAGGYGASYSPVTKTYLRQGTSGGDGAVLIEWVE